MRTPSRDPYFATCPISGGQSDCVVFDHDPEGPFARLLDTLTDEQQPLQNCNLASSAKPTPGCALSDDKGHLWCTKYPDCQEIDPADPQFGLVWTVNDQGFNTGMMGYFSPLKRPTKTTPTIGCAGGESETGGVGWCWGVAPCPQIEYVGASDPNPLMYAPMPPFPSAPPAPLPPPGAVSVPTGRAVKDPHINFAYGGSAELRGRHNALYNFLSVPDLSVNVKTEEAIFTLHGGALKVNGSFLTEAHVTAQLSSRKLATASFWASELDPNNFGWRVINGTCVGRPFKFGFRGKKECFDLKMAMDHSSATFAFRNWTVSVRGTLSCKGCLLAGPAHRLDIGFAARGNAPSRDKPHGIIGSRLCAVHHRPQVTLATRSMCCE